MLKDTVRKYGQAPYKIATIHGGPGAPGSIAPVARELSSCMGVLEPLQTADSVEGQILELKSQLGSAADLPVTLVGASWGAMLAFMFAARFPEYVSKVIMVGSGPYETNYTEGMMDVRLSRLTEAEREETLAIMKAMADPSYKGNDELLAKFGSLMSKADAYDPLPTEHEAVECQYDIHIKVWEDAAAMRKSGKMLELGKSIKCPVVAIHGDYDPHPIEGVREPLSKILRDFRMYILKNCGHEPWVEREARDEFFEILKRGL